MRQTRPRSCPHCGHSTTAHSEGRCVLCTCRVVEPGAFQESLAFRTSLPVRDLSDKRRGH